MSSIGLACVLKNTNLVIRFILELCALAGLAYWGVRSGATSGLKVALGVGLPLLMAVFWGLFVAPKALLGGSRGLRLVLGLGVFVLVAGAIAGTGHAALGWSFGGAALVNTILTYAWGPQPGETSRAAHHAP